MSILSKSTIESEEEINKVLKVMSEFKAEVYVFAKSDYPIWHNVYVVPYIKSTLDQYGYCIHVTKYTVYIYRNNKYFFRYLYIKLMMTLIGIYAIIFIIAKIMELVYRL